MGDDRNEKGERMVLFARVSPTHVINAFIFNSSYEANLRA